MSDRIPKIARAIKALRDAGAHPPCFKHVLSFSTRDGVVTFREPSAISTRKLLNDLEKEMRQHGLEPELVYTTPLEISDDHL